MKERWEKEKKRRRRKKQKGVGREENSAMSTVPCGNIVRSIHSHHNQDRGVATVKSQNTSSQESSCWMLMAMPTILPLHPLCKTLYSRVAVPFYSPTATHEWSNLPRTPPALGAGPVFYAGESCRRVYGTSSGLEFPFANAWWCTSFCAVCHLLAFISLTFLCVFCSCTNWIICFCLTWT